MIWKGLAKYRTAVHWFLPLLYLFIAKPTSWGLIMGALLVLGGEGLRIWASGYIEKGEKLATSGPYAYTRHPLYLGNFFMGLGICFLAGRLHITLPLFFLVFALFYIPTMALEESFLSSRFGEEYKRYKESVPVFLPLGKRWRGGAEKFHWDRVKANREINSLFFSLGLVIAFYIKHIVLTYI